MESTSILVTLVIDNRDVECRSSFVYIADVTGFALLVYDVTTARMWKVIDKTFYPYPSHGTFTIEHESFDLMDGILGMDLEPYVHGRDRRLFYHALASPTENWVHTSYLRNQSLFQDDPASSPGIFNTFKTMRHTQAAAMAIDKDGVEYFGLMSETSLDCWNTQSAEYGRYINSIVRDKVKLQFLSGVKIVNNLKRSQELWVVSCRFQRLMAGTFNPNEINFRIHAGKTSELLTKTNCRNPGGAGGGTGGGFLGGGVGTGAGLGNHVGGGGYGLHKPFTFA